MINSSKTLTITVDETFVIFVIMLNSSSSKAFEFVSFVIFLCRKKSFRGFTSGNYISLLFQRLCKIIIIVSMIFELIIAPDKKIQLFIITLLFSFNQDVLKDTFFWNFNLFDIFQYCLLLHYAFILWIWRKWDLNKYYTSQNIDKKGHHFLYWYQFKIFIFKIYT